MSVAGEWCRIAKVADMTLPPQGRPQATLDRLRQAGPRRLMRAAINRGLRVGQWAIGVALFALHLPLLGLVRSFRQVRIGVLPTDRLGHLAVNLDLYLRRQRESEPQTAQRSRQVILLVAGRPANAQLLRMWRRLLPVYESPFLHAVLRTSERLWMHSPFYQPLEMQSNEYEVFGRLPPVLAFTPDEEDEGRRRLKDWGINVDRDWFVCVYARDDTYLNTIYPKAGNWSYHDNRNADIDSFVPAMQEIARRGGFAIRMGYSVAEPLASSSPGVIDYASCYRSDFMDIYLAAKCRFFMGTTGGIGDVATAFNRPRLGVNWVPFGNAPLTAQSICLPKLIVDPATGRNYTFRRLLEDFSRRDDPKLWDGVLALSLGYRYVDNTPADLEVAVREMLDRLEAGHLASAEDGLLQATYRALMPPDHWCAGIATPIGSEFLRTHRQLLEG